MNGVDRRQLLHDEAEESLTAYYSRHTVRSWQEYLNSNPEALVERATERLPPEPEAEAATDAWFKQHFRSVEDVLKLHGFLYRDLCYKHHCSELDKLPLAARWRASTWRTVERADCEMCNAMGVLR